MAKLKEWHLRREKGIWRVYHLTTTTHVWGTAMWLTERCVASSPNMQQAIELGRHHAADLATLKLLGHA